MLGDFIDTSEIADEFQAVDSLASRQLHSF